MNQQYIENLINAKTSLQLWISNVKQRKMGNQMFSSEIEVDRTKTEFANWYYGEGQTFSSFETFRNIENYYHKMYDQFVEFNSLINAPIKKSWFSNNAEKRKLAINKTFKKIEFSYSEVVECLEIFQNKLIDSPLFADSSFAKKIKEEREVISESDFLNIPTEEAISISLENNDVIEKETSIDLNETVNLVDQEPLPIEENAIVEEEETNFKFNDINEFIKKSPTLEEEATIKSHVEQEIEAFSSIKSEEEIPVEIEDIESNNAFEIKEEKDISQIEIDKKAVLDVSDTTKTEKKIKSNHVTLSEIDIEEEIRRILN